MESPLKTQAKTKTAVLHRDNLVPKASTPRLKVREKKGKFEISHDHPDEMVGTRLLMKAVGANDSEFLDGFLHQLVSAGMEGRNPDSPGINFMLSVVKSVGPKDQIEAMLAAQMAAVHMATMTFARRLAHVDNIPQQDSAERALNKLARTFASQMEALNRHRGKGQQKVTVEHVHVHAGGQAVVGSVETLGGGDRPKSKDQPHAIAHAPGATMPSTDTPREPVTVACDEERSLPDARRNVPGRAEGE